MKKIYPIFLGFITALLLFYLPITASATGTHTASPYRDTIRNYDGAFVKMYEAMVEGTEFADLSPYKLKPADVVQIYSDVLLASPELFYVDNTVTYYFNQRDHVTKVEFNYLMNVDERAEALQTYEREIDYIVSLVDPALSDAEKALFVHDYLIASYAYDAEEANYDALSLFRERKGVCQAYSLAYMAVLREFGMDVVMVTSDEMNHAWNLVKIDNMWYHVDLSFDDPSPDRLGRVMHDNFLLDDEAVKTTATPHYGWKSAIRCLSKSWGDPIWDGVTARMIEQNGQWYYIDPSAMTLAVSAFDGSHRSDVFRFKERWTASPGGDSYYVGVFSGLSECLGHLFVNTPYDIMIYSPQTGDVSVYLENASERLLFGSTVYHYSLEYMTATAPDGTDGSRQTFEITDFSGESFGEILPFNDLSRLDPYYAAVKFVYSRGLFRGVSTVKFAPDAYLTRAMFVTVLGRLCGVNESLYADVTFEDVAAGQWYSPFVEWAALAGIVNGVGDNRFDPLGEITHEQMYKIVAMCGEYLDAGTMETDTALVLYDDRAKISDWAFDSVAYCKMNGLIGDKFAHKIYPTSKATRAEAAEIISKFAILCGKA